MKIYKLRNYFGYATTSIFRVVSHNNLIILFKLTNFDKLSDCPRVLRHLRDLREIFVNFFYFYIYQTLTKYFAFYLGKNLIYQN